MEQTSWYAIYTAHRAEKCVKKRLDQAGIENYVPLRVVDFKQVWGMEQVEVPLVSGYIFVRVARVDFGKVLSIPGVLSFLMEKEHPVRILDEEVQSLRLLNDYAEEIVFVEKDIPELSFGRVVHGKLTGLVGKIEHDGEHCRVFVRVFNVGSVVTTISSDCVDTAI